MRKAIVLSVLFLFFNMLQGCSGVNPIEYKTDVSVNTQESNSDNKALFNFSQIDKYCGKNYVTVNNNKPYFTKNEITTTVFEKYSELDHLGRCGTAFACIGKELMPTEERGPIGSVKPTGWHTVKYSGIDGNYLYNRCHLIAFCLTGENANDKNLITGTRQMNTESMLPFEEKVAKYIDSTGNHVLYRVTPVFEGDNLLASGVLMEALSVEDNGSGICFCIYCYNIQDGISIDYSNGKSNGPEYGTERTPNTHTFYLNINTKKFHTPDCENVSKISNKNLKKYEGDKQTLIDNGYDGCKICNP